MPFSKDTYLVPGNFVLDRDPNFSSKRNFKNQNPSQNWTCKSRPNRYGSRI